MQPRESVGNYLGELIAVPAAAFVGARTFAITTEETRRQLQANPNPSVFQKDGLLRLGLEAWNWQGRNRAEVYLTLDNRSNFPFRVKAADFRLILPGAFYWQQATIQCQVPQDVPRQDTTQLVGFWDASPSGCRDLERSAEFL